MPVAILEGHDLIHDRLKFPQYIQFPNRLTIPNPYILYNVDENDIPFVLPALFIWIDTGIQELKPDTTSPSHVKFLDSQLCEMPTKEFMKKDITKSAILMLSPNLVINRNFLTEVQVKNYYDGLKPFITKFQEFFTGEKRNG